MDSVELTGELYTETLKRFHDILKPRTYLEIGTMFGATLALSNCRSIAVDPKFYLQGDVLGRKPSCQLFQMTSDAFFEGQNPKSLLNAPIDMAFLDGMHLFEFLLRDFKNTEKHCKKNSIIFIHDCIPHDQYNTTRSISDPDREKSSHKDWWTGDVWKILPALKKYRPDLAVTVLDALPTGLVLVTNLDPSSTTLDDLYQKIVSEFLDQSLTDFGLQKLLEVANIKPTSSVATKEDIWKHYWL